MTEWHLVALGRSGDPFNHKIRSLAVIKNAVKMRKNAGCEWLSFSAIHLWLNHKRQILIPSLDRALLNQVLWWHRKAISLYCVSWLFVKALAVVCVYGVWRRCSRPPASCSWMEWETLAASSCSVSWTPLTAWASVALLTRTPAVTCSSLPTNMSCSTLWRCPRQRSSCCCRSNRWGMG